MFLFTEEDREKLNSWLATHNKECRYADPCKTGAIGGRLTYLFTPTSLGLITKVRCACGKTVDLTDYESW